MVDICNELFRQLESLAKQNTFLKDEFTLLLSSTKTIINNTTELQVDQLTKAQTMPTLRQLKSFLNDCQTMIEKGKGKGGLARFRAKTFNKEKYIQRFATMHEELNKIRSSMVGLICYIS